VSPEAGGDFLAKIWKPKFNPDPTFQAAALDFDLYQLNKKIKLQEFIQLPVVFDQSIDEQLIVDMAQTPINTYDIRFAQVLGLTTSGFLSGLTLQSASLFIHWFLQDILLDSA